ncbi:Processing of GAS1 and ALP protein 2 [Nakaseomyces bracarensis]|uniref:Processing of GAS1 and ALP protein 2 n=1 Tax=Nakaseomyces bracarensis TaxID=273131 RepID=A0ABR4NUS1_9SACH
MDKIAKIFENSWENIVNIDPKKGLRLVIIAGAYILLRGLVTRDQNRRQLARQVRQQEEKVKEERQKTLLERPDELDVSAQSSSTEFGWGKKTRHRVKKQQQLFESAVEDLKRQQELKLSGAIRDDSDEEIEELLED